MVQILLNTEPTSDVAYKPLPGQPTGPTLITRLSRGNLLGMGRAYLTKQVMPQVQLPLENGDLRRAPSLDKLHANTVIHNSDDHVSTRCHICKPLEPGSNRSCVLTLTATALGSGVLALPYAFSQVGLVVGVCLLSVAACLSCVALTILMLASRYTEAESFASLLTLASGSSKAGLVMDVLLVTYGCAVLLALLIFEGDFIPAILDAFGVPTPGRPKVILGVAAMAWPLVLPSKISALRYCAALSPLAILFVAANVVVQTPAFFAESSKESSPALYSSSPQQMLQAMTIFVFSVMCHANAVPVVHMLERPSVERIVKVATYSNTCCWALYLLIGVGGYLSFQASVQGDFLLNYPVGSVSILCCRMLLAVVCYVGIPMNSSCCTQALQKLLAAVVQRTPEPQMEERPLLFASLATLILAMAAVGAIHLQDVAQVISVVGGSLTTLQMFWIPAFIYWKILYPSQPPIFRKCVLILMILAGSAGFTSVLATLLDTVA